MASSSASASSVGAPGPEAESTLPHDFSCPILHEVMHDPCIAADGYSYEREAIQDWLTRSDKSPMTGLPLANRELRDNRALKVAIEAFLQETGKLNGKVQTLTMSNIDKDACLRALDADLKRAEAKQGNTVSLVEHERLLTEVKHLRRRLQFAEETNLLSSKRRRLSEDDQGQEAAMSPHASDVADTPPQATSAASGSGSGTGKENQDEDYRLHVDSMMSSAQQRVAERLQQISAKLSFLQNSHKAALSTVAGLSDAVKEHDRDVDQDEAKVVAARGTLSQLHDEMEEKWKAREEKGKLCIEQAEAVGIMTMPETLKQVPAAPQDFQNGHLGDYARLHVEWEALKERHRQEMEAVGALEASANASRAAREAVQARWEAAKSHANDLAGEARQLSQSKSKVESECSSFETRRERLLQCFDSAFGPQGILPAMWAAQPPNNMTMLSMLDAVVAARLEGLHEKLQAEVVNKIQKSHENLLTECLRTTLAEQSAETRYDLVRLCKPPASNLQRHGFSADKLMEIGYSFADLLDGGFDQLEVLQVACANVPVPPAPDAGDVVTHVFRSAKIQSSRREAPPSKFMDSPELQFSSVAYAAWKYSFTLSLLPHGESGSIGLFFALKLGPHPDSLLWPMPKERFTIKLRILAAAGQGLDYAEGQLDGMKSAGFAEYLAKRTPDAASNLDWAHGRGFKSLVGQAAANTGSFFLGDDADSIAVQCELCLR
mmetsp:Transcript_75914/g.180438  ORF Transcript_75914/g.180438 Transcript_75914/m.180438 type:complete len:719 (+) Transcript_75914:60-2216(+)